MPSIAPAPRSGQFKEISEHSNVSSYQLQESPGGNEFIFGPIGSNPADLPGTDDRISPSDLSKSDLTAGTISPSLKAEMEALGEDAAAVQIFGGLVLVGAAGVLSLFYLSISSIVACITVAVGFVVWRHYSLKGAQSETRGRIWLDTQQPTRPETGHLPAVYFLYVLGSGGHTAEMCEMIKKTFRGNRNIHRRYVSTTGDTQSALAIARLETLIKESYPLDARGSWDHFQVKRARAVHQPFYTAWYTSLWSAMTIVNALTREPNERPFSEHGDLFKYPHLVVTNGPGTGFVLCFVAHLLKIFYLVPPNRLKLVYVESWAHTRSLSLTGKLFHWTGIADLFCVQHRSLAEKFGKLYVGVVAERTTPVD
ncbi:hypothetical protein VTK73DRAFT_8506 [Phialemonium thermophilum]|uniref:UDP-N-acetylglucosamine transferase subunit ALG14 n=1 Tax=Phialemonium thermophilum TaxID=223376 RepID=A0ABR3XPS7_9PEZI